MNGLAQEINAKQLTHLGKVVLVLIHELQCSMGLFIEKVQ